MKRVDKNTKVNEVDDEEDWSIGRNKLKTAFQKTDGLPEVLLTVEEEMRLAVEDVMYLGETEEEKQLRHKKLYESFTSSDVPSIDFSDIDFDLPENEDKEVNDISSALSTELEVNLPVKKKFPVWARVVTGVVSALLLFSLFLLFTKPGHSLITKTVTKIAMSGAKVDDPSNVVKVDENELAKNDPDSEFIVYATATPTPTPTIIPIVTVTPTTAPVVTQKPRVSMVPTDTPSPTPTPWVYPERVEDDSVVNVLLIGIENIYNNSSNGRSDAILVASIDKDGGPIKLVSLMRDLYVQIPGYNPNKLNASYAFGGAPLLMETIELNFGIPIDSYVKIDFKGFEALIDYIGGVTISLTEKEASYLNSTNYISDPKQRNVVVGSQVLTGAQALGYCRIRNVSTANGLYVDFGRTYRQRTVLMKIFEEYKSASPTQLYQAMNELMKYVTVSPNLEGTAADLLQVVIEKQMFELKNSRLPFSGIYRSETINGKEVLIYDAENIEVLREFLYDSDKTE